MHTHTHGRKTQEWEIMEIFSGKKTLYSELLLVGKNQDNTSIFWDPLWWLFDGHFLVWFKSEAEKFREMGLEVETQSGGEILF